jgi:DNA replication and repair protein RecF
MVLKDLELQNFRLHNNTVLKFSDKLNYIVGGNGQGKTTILESIYYLCTTKNLNQALDKEVVSFSKESFEIRGRFKEKVENKVQLQFSNETNRKHTLLDEKSITRASDLIGKFPVVTLVQLDHAITMGSPVERRKFVDSVISQSSETYLRILIDYNKILKQRSQLLSEIRERYDQSLIAQLDAWTESLIKNGSELIKHRMAFCNEFQNYLTEAYSKIMSETETPGMEYLFFDNVLEVDQIEQRFKELLNDERDNEIRRAANLIGPHRDDFLFTINGMELRKYGSQGQHKTFQIALRFGEFFFIKEKQGITPIFLMDDVFGELDTYRAQKISDYLNEIGQAFITMTDFGRLEKLNSGNGDLVIKVENGSINYERL